MIPFIKAHACGNDFLIVTEEAASGYDKVELTSALCDRNAGIGADGVEYFKWLNDRSARIRLFNSDGSIAEISGNGTRCVAAWMTHESGAQAGDELSIETDAGVRLCTIRELRTSSLIGPTAMITTDMDVPEIEERTVELADGTIIEGVAVSMGNPHFVIVLPSPGVDLLSADNALDAGERALARLDFSISGRSWEEVGEEICFHPDFPDQTNVEFVHVLGNNADPIRQVAMRIFERGVGPTASSGTGTSATAAAMIGVHHADHELDVIAPGGAQTVHWPGPGEKLYLTGPATLIARGEFWSGDSF